jgi:putative transposase
LKLPAIIKCLRHRKLIGVNEVLSGSSVHRYLHAENLTSLNESARDRRLFESAHPNEIWQSDVMHGPFVKHDGKVKKSYLIAIIDDHSRLIIHAEFYLAETLKNFLDSLRQGIMARGLPQKLYIDNGACYKTLHLEQVAAQLGIGISHSRPYTPQGRGKIERWFKFVRENFLASLMNSERREKLDLLNHHFAEWVDEYNNRVHSTTKQTPYERYRANLECARPAPKELIDYFRAIEFRRVKKDRTIRLHGQIFEAPVGLIDRQVELRFHPENLAEVEIFFDGKSNGMAVPVNPQVNAKIGRDWGHNPSEPKSKKEFREEQLELPFDKPPTGQLFGAKVSQDKGAP